MNNKMDLFSQEEPFLSVQMVTKSFRIASSKIDVLKGVSFSARRGEWLALVGASGSGKTDLGPLPVTAKVLLGCLAAAWVLILVWLFVGRMKRINEKRL